MPEEMKFPYDYEVVDVEAMFVDKGYQRPLSTLVTQIANEFDPALVGVLSLSKREDGRYALIDGQTRWQAIKDKNLAYVRDGERDVMGRREDGEYTPIRHLPSLVYYGLSRADEAYLFAKFQTERRRVTAYQRFKALVAARDDQSRAIDKAVSAVGLDLSERGEAGKINAITALERIYKRDPALLREALFVCSACFAEDPEGIRGEIIGGIAAFIQSEKNVDLERLVDRLHRVDQLTLRRRSAAMREGRGGGYTQKHMADVIAAEYRKRA